MTNAGMVPPGPGGFGYGPLPSKVVITWLSRAYIGAVAYRGMRDKGKMKQSGRYPPHEQLQWGLFDYKPVKSHGIPHILARDGTASPSG